MICEGAAMLARRESRPGAGPRHTACASRLATRKSAGEERQTLWFAPPHDAPRCCCPVSDALCARVCGRAERAGLVLALEPQARPQARDATRKSGREGMEWARRALGRGPAAAEPAVFDNGRDDGRDKAADSAA